ncbi:hypothetical protein AncyloWKF20_07485 [Ancylobacter sp. WKF20]|uniref:hypothetical protein n=1 Tax=Ancylobacter sp. WKF20 TaxID=3039801 RepID=UPI0024342E66|nr:hypothetical protein [Ancylobacter sp. WKF20]WGD31651.1 hypothetical protein AncyloWKF20_07485 [Ancylobacter sp. WKF20]
MAKLPGLVPVNEDSLQAGPRRSRAPRRVAPDPIEERALRPMAAPVNTYVRPPEPQRGNDLLDLAQALQGLSPTLQQAFANMETKQKASAQAEVAQLSEAQLKQHVLAGTAPATVTGAGRKEFDRLGAQQVAINRVTALQSAWESGEFDRDTGDFDAFIAQAAQEDLKGITDPEARAAYGAVLNKFGPNLRARQTEYRVKKERDTALNMVGDKWFAGVAAGISEGKTPEELQAALRAEYPHLKDTLNLSPQDLDGVVLNVTRRLAETPGNDRYVEHFLNDTRGGVGSIAAKQDAGPTAQVIINKAQATTAAHQREQLRLQNKANADKDEAVVQSRLEVAAENGTLAFMTPVEVRTESGDTKSVSADDLQKQGVELIRKKAEQMAASGDGEGAMNFRVQALSRNGLVDPQFKSILGAGPSSASHEALQKGEVPAALRAGAQLYESLYARNPRLLAQHVKESDQFFYEAFRVARQEMNYDEAGAFEAAMKFTDRADPQELPMSLRQNFQTVTDKVGQLRRGDSMLNPLNWFSGKPAMTVSDETAAKLEKWGQFYVRLGKAPDEAIELAKDRIQATHTVINGEPVMLTDAAVPPNAEDIINWKIEQWAEKYGASLGLSASDISVRAAGDGQQGVFQLWRRNGEGPLMIDDPAARAAMSFSLRGAKAEYEGVEKARILREQNDRRPPAEKWKSGLKDKGIRWENNGKRLDSWE